jgi:hypothetical protein
MTDTNYNDGKWHGWNGGECPVHPKTEVSICFCDGVSAVHDQSTADQWEWEKADVVAFRVTKEHKETREFWISNNDGFAHDSLESVLRDPLTEKHGYIHVREVIGDDT